MATLHCVPFLVLNYGCEMIFILEQRLAAQSVGSEKRDKVLSDVSCAVFSDVVVDALFQPQPVYSPQTTRQLFDKLAQSSIMRLSPSSMDKLFDLMTMACKYQFVACRSPRDVLRATMLHLDSVRVSIASSEKATAAVDRTLSKVKSLGEQLSDGQFIEIRHGLLNYFQGKRVKISLLMQEGLQKSDGGFVHQRCAIPASERSVPTIPIGTVHYYDAAGVQVARTATVPHPDTGIEREGAPDNRLGRNLYTIDRKKNGGASGGASSGSAAGGSGSAPAASSPLRAASSRPFNAVERAVPTGRATAHLRRDTPAVTVDALLNFLVANAPREAASDTIHHLFDPAPPGSNGAASGGGADVIHISAISREAMERNNAELVNVMASFDAGSPKDARGGGGAAAAPRDAGDDLLDLLDSGA